MTSLMLTIPLTIITVLSILLNVFIIIIVVVSRQAAVANNILLLHLGSVNTLLGLLFLVFSTPGLVRTTTPWLTAGPACCVHGFLFQLLHPVLLWTLCGLNCDRYYAIAAPLHYSHIVNSKKVLIGLAFGWFVSLSLCLPPLFSVAPYTFIPGFGACAADFARGVGALWYSCLYTAFTLVLPATLIICCNVKILMIARYHRHRIASAIYEVTLSAQVTITHQRNPFFVPTVTAPSAGGPKFRGARSPVSALLQIVGSILVLYLPYYSTILWDSSVAVVLHKPSPLRAHPDLQSLVFALLCCSPMINGFLYGVRSKVIRKTFQNYWRKQVTKNEVNQEIQARTPSTCGSRRQSLTPLGFFTTRNTIPRRLSEALLEVQNVVSPKSVKMKRIASEMAWNHLSTDEEAARPRIIQTASCNTLKVPNDDFEITADDVINAKLTPHRLIDNILTLPTRPSLSSTNLFLQKFFTNTEKKPTQAKSPTILITRAFSDEAQRKDSIKLEDEESETWCPLLNDSNRNNNSDSSENSETSSGGLYMTLDRFGQDSSVSTELESDSLATNEESQLLLSSFSERQRLRDKRKELRNSFFQQNGICEVQEVVL